MSNEKERPTGTRHHRAIPKLGMPLPKVSFGAGEVVARVAQKGQGIVRLHQREGIIKKIHQYWDTHVDENHYRRAKDGDAAPVVGCYFCECDFPGYFAGMREARAEYDRRPYHDPVDHERGHPERPQIAYEERHGNGPDGDGSQEMWDER